MAAWRLIGVVAVAALALLSLHDGQLAPSAVRQFPQPQIASLRPAPITVGVPVHTPLVPISRFDARPTFIERHALALSAAPVDRHAGLHIDSNALEWLPAAFQLRVGDRILLINGDPITSTTQLVEAARGASEGSAVELWVKRSDSGEVVSYWASL